MDIGSKVKIINCESCPSAVGKTATIKTKTEDGKFQLNFGRGRPQKYRPEFFNLGDIELADNTEPVLNEASSIE